jgi:hypothetical protein
VDTPTAPLPPVAPVFPMLVGCWRSGTTLLRSVFDSHPDVAVPDETGFIPGAITRYRTHQFGFADYLDALHQTRRHGLWCPPNEVLERAAAIDPPSDLADAVRLTFRAYAWVNGKARYGDKTPSHLLRLDDIAELLPETRFVHLIRDGRDVALALVAAGFGPRTLEEAALHWQSRVSTGRRLGTALGPARYREVRYEALVADPASTLREVCAFLDLTFDEAMLHHEHSAETLVQRTVNPEFHDALAQPIRPGLRDWRRDMPRRQQARFELVAGDLLVELGYGRGEPAPSISVRAESLVRRTSRRVVQANRHRRGLASAHWW